MEVPRSDLSTLKAGFFSSAQTGLETALRAGRLHRGMECRQRLWMSIAASSWSDAWETTCVVSGIRVGVMRGLPARSRPAPPPEFHVHRPDELKSARGRKADFHRNAVAPSDQAENGTPERGDATTPSNGNAS